MTASSSAQIILYFAPLSELCEQSRMTAVIDGTEQLFIFLGVVGLLKARQKLRVAGIAVIPSYSATEQESRFLPLCGFCSVFRLNLHVSSSNLMSS